MRKIADADLMRMIADTFITGYVAGLLLLGAIAAYGQFIMPIFEPPVQSGDVTFTPLHLFFVDPSNGSDANNGLTPGAAWATANHSVACGDILLVQSSVAYYTTVANGPSAGQQVFGDENYPTHSFGAVSGCPSTSGGIDGTGGIYFAILLCVGPDLMSCPVDGGGGPAFDVSLRPNWWISGFLAKQNTNADRACFASLGQNPGDFWGYLGFSNSIANVCDLAGFSTGNDLGSGWAGVDQTAIVGTAVFNGANSLGPFGVCGSGYSTIPANANSAAGTHIFLDQNFASHNTNAPGGTECTVGGGTPTTCAMNGACPHSDGEGYIHDTWGACPQAGCAANAYNSKAVTRNSVFWAGGNACIEIFPAGSFANTDVAQYVIYNVTCYGNNQDTLANCAGELFLNQVYPTLTGSESWTKSIFRANEITCGNNGNTTFPVTAAVVDSAGFITPLVTLADPPVDISGNYIWNSAGGGGTGLGGNNTSVFNQGSTTWVFGTNTYSDPGLTSPGSLPSAAFDCTGYQLVPVCMNTKYGIYNSVKPTIAPTTVGYQPPGPCVASDPDYPSYIKGVAGLVVASGGFTTSAKIVQKSGFLTKPCNM